ncbi:hypothetical protein [Propionivibrio sp.]|uniref:hypothetical protein n=1 Tax=Propionivibrio sp. TaxID=2212460 RepID=UPI003BF00DFD
MRKFVDGQKTRQKFGVSNHVLSIPYFDVQLFDVEFISMAGSRPSPELSRPRWM